MQQFDISVRRRMILRPMLMKEVGDYCVYQCHKLTFDKIVEKIENLRKKVADKEKWTIALQTHEGNVFGILEVEEISSGKAKASIEIPNEGLMYAYGDDAVDQFVKVCKERKYFSEIVLDDNKIMNKYVRIRQLDGNIIKLAV